MKFLQSITAGLLVLASGAIALPASVDTTGLVVRSSKPVVLQEGSELQRRGRTGHDYGSIDADAIAKITQGRSWKDLTKSEQARLSGIIDKSLTELQNYGKAHPYPKGTKWIMTEKPPKGQTGFVVDHDAKTITYYFGDDAPHHAATIKYLHAAYPEYRDAGFKRRNADERKAITRSQTLGTSISHPGADRNEEPMISILYATGAHVVCPVPHEESKWQAQMARQAAKEDPDQKYDHYFVDNRSSKTSGLKAYPWRGPDNVKGYPDPLWPLARVDDTEILKYITHDATLTLSHDSKVLVASGGRYNLRSGKSSKRAATKTIIERQMAELTSEMDNTTDISTVNDQQFISDYSDYFGALQNNATALLQPVLVNMLNNTNSLLLESMAWSLYSMVTPGVAMFGPFMGDMDAIDYFEAQSAPYFFPVSNSTTGVSNTTAPYSNRTAPYSNSTLTALNGTLSNDTAFAAANKSMTAIYEFNDALLTNYYQTYAQAVAAVNATGLLQQMDDLLEALMPSPEAAALMPESETTVDSHALDPFIPFLQSMYEYNGVNPNNTMASIQNGTIYMSSSGSKEVL